MEGACSTIVLARPRRGSIAPQRGPHVTTTKRSHIGRAGDHAVMAEFLLRGWNVAIPEVDVGDDIFVVDDNADRVIRVQVKTAERVQPAGGGVRAVYAGVPVAQIWSGALPFFYVFVLRNAQRWEFVVMRRERLRDLRARIEAEAGLVTDTPRPGGRAKVTRPAGGASPSPQGTLSLAFVFTDSEVTLWGKSVQTYRNNWSEFPEITSGPGATARGARASASATPQPPHAPRARRGSSR